MRLRGTTVLLVEDDVDNLELLGSFFESEGARTLCAGSIAAALAMALDHRVDIVVSDLELADGDGCALLKQLHLQDRRTLPAIAITGYSQQEWRNRAAGCGFTRYAVKPFSLELLTNWIVELTRNSTASGESVEF